MKSDSPDLKTAMLDRIRADAPHRVCAPSDFVDLASRDAIDKAFVRHGYDDIDLDIIWTTATEGIRPVRDAANQEIARADSD